MGADDPWGLPREGDLDPDLTEEASDSDWEAPRRGVWPIVLRIVTVLLVAALAVVPVVLLLQAS